MARIRRCENTAYGRDNHFSSIRSVDDFRRSHPVTDFARVEEYVNRMADGDKSALLGDEDDIYMFQTSSGTTGKNKRIPLSAQAARDYQDHMLSGPYQWAIRRDLGSWNLRRMINISNGRTPEYTKSGHVLGVAASILYDKMNRVFKHIYTSPLISLQVKSEFESQYIHMLFGLRDKEIFSIIAVFVHNFLSWMRRMEVYQEDLVNDVRRGRIKEDLNIPQNVRAELNAKLSPMPERAAEIQREFAKGFKGIIPRLWPYLTRVTGLWSGASNEIYYKEAKEMTGPDVHIVSFTYSASESLMGVNMKITRPGAPRYALLPDTTFYEFLPIHNDRVPDLEEINPKDLLLPHQLKIGQEYELILTNSSGFYRYRVGDVLRVVGFYQQSPQLEFLYRSGQALNVNGEKLSEEVFFRALREAAKRWPSTLKDHTVAGSQFAPSQKGTLDPHYLLFIEVEGKPLTEEETGLVDAILREQDDEYASFRKLGKIVQMKVHQMPTGTFSRFRSHLIETTAVTAAQFKMPRVLKSRDKVEWFLSNV